MKTKMIIYKATTLMLTTIFLTSCTTTSLWRSTDPDECIEISFDEMTEEDLKSDGIPYRKDEDRQLFYVERNTKQQKFRDYALRVAGTPFTLAADACMLFVPYGGLVEPGY